MELIIDVVSGGKKVIQRHHAKGEQLSIGRGYNNDVILNDPYVCAKHLNLAVNEDGFWQAEDCDSVNGSFDANANKVGQTVVHSGDVIEIGKTRLRFIYPNQPVAPAIELGAVERLVTWVSSPLVLFMLVASFFVLSLGKYYVSTFIEIKTSKMFASAFMEFVALCMLPLVLGAIARIFKNDARLLTQLAICLCFVIISNFIDLFGAVIDFNISYSGFTEFLGLVFQLGLTFGFLWFTLYVALHQGVVRRTLFAAGYTAAIFMLSAIYDVTTQRDFNPVPVYNSTILAPEFAFSDTVTVKEFIASSESIFEKSAAKIDED